MRVIRSTLADETALKYLEDQEIRDAILRQLRRPVLNAFDIYKSNVLYGVREETPEEKAEVLAWYRAVLDLEQEAIMTPHPAVASYMGGVRT